MMERFRIPIESYRFLLDEQGHGCAICGNEATPTRALAIDHDHATDTIGGLLCTRCNMLIGYARDNPGVLDSAANYLKKVRPLQSDS
jgi:hypothetical protein